MYPLISQRCLSLPLFFFPPPLPPFNKSLDAAPEVWGVEVEKTQYGAESDMFAFGVVLFQMAYGLHPFAGPQQNKIDLDAWLHCILPEIPRGQPPQVEQLIRGCVTAPNLRPTAEQALSLLKGIRR